MTNWLGGLGVLGVGLTLLCGCSGDDGNSSTAPAGGGGWAATGGTAGATGGRNAPAGGRSATGGSAGTRATGGSSNPSECPAVAPKNNPPTSCSSLDLECYYANEGCSCQGEMTQSFVCWNT
jgi:hypothetical protein